MSSKRTSSLTLDAAEVADLIYLLGWAIDTKADQLADIGDSEPFSDPDERDEIRGNLKREIAVAEVVVSKLRQRVAVRAMGIDHTVVSPLSVRIDVGIGEEKSGERLKGVEGLAAPTCGCPYSRS